MPGIGSLICEIDIKIQKFKEGKRLLLSKTNARFLSVTVVFTPGRAISWKVGAMLVE